MRKQWRVALFLVFVGVLLALAVGLLVWMTKETKHHVYYVDGDHANAGDSEGYGSIDRPWQTLKYAFNQLQAGDTLLIRGGVYPGANVRLSGVNSGVMDAPITVKAYPGETVIWRRAGERMFLTFEGTEWWVIEGLIFEGQDIRVGTSMETIGRHITLRECVFRDSQTKSVKLDYAEHIVVDRCHFARIQSPEAGKDVSALGVPGYGRDIVIRDSKFEDISSDGVHLGSQGGDMRDVVIEGNEFWINNPDGVFLGENGIDVKRVQGPVVIRGNEIHGFRPTVEGQNASGAHGAGIVIHDNAQNVTVERNLFYDNTTHVTVSQGTDGEPWGTRGIVVRNNIFRGARASSRAGVSEGGYALNVKRAAAVEVYHNTIYDNDIYLRSVEAAGCVFKNNIIFGGGAKMVTSDEEWEADYNAWSEVGETVPSELRGVHDLSGSDLRLGADLQPLPDSPIIDAGHDAGVSDDFEGDLRRDSHPDLGAFEYISHSSATSWSKLAKDSSDSDPHLFKSSSLVH